MRIYKVTANGTEYIMTDRNTAMAFAEVALNCMNVQKKYSWSGKVTIELEDVEGTPEPIEDDDESGVE